MRRPPHDVTSSKAAALWTHQYASAGGRAHAEGPGSPRGAKAGAAARKDDRTAAALAVAASAACS